MSTPSFERFDEQMAERLRAPDPSGLPGFLGIRTVEVGPGTMSAELDARADLHNPFGSLHGGVLAGLVDHMLGAVLYPVIPPGAWAATTEFKVNYAAPVREGTVRADATIISMTKRTAVVRIEVSNEDRLVCAAQGTVLIKHPSG